MLPTCRSSAGLGRAARALQVTLVAGLAALSALLGATAAEAVTPVLTLTVSAPPSADGLGYRIGETVPFSFTVTNIGDVGLSDVAVSETTFINNGKDVLTLTTGPTAAAGFNGTLAPGGQVVFTGSYLVTGDDADARGPLSNTATTTATVPPAAGFTGAPPSATGQTSVPVSTPSMELIKSANPVGPVGAATTVTYSFAATNTGSVPMTGVTLTEDSFTNGAGTALQFNAPPAVSSPAGFAGDLPAGATVVWTAKYTVTGADVIAADPLENQARVTGQQVPVGGAPSPQVSIVGSTTLEMTPPGVPGISAETTISPPGDGVALRAGETATYTFTVMNTGNTFLTGVTFSEQSFVNGAGSARSLTTGPTAPAGFTGELAPGGVAAFTGTYLVTAEDGAAGGPLVNTAQTSGAYLPTPVFSGPNPTAADDISAAVATPAITLDESVSSAAATAGAAINFTYTATNTGTSVLSDVTLANSEFTNGAGKTLALDAPPGVVAPAAFAGTLQPGEKVTWSAPYTVQAADVSAGGLITNRAAVTAAQTPVGQLPRPVATATAAATIPVTGGGPATSGPSAGGGAPPTGGGGKGSATAARIAYTGVPAIQLTTLAALLLVVGVATTLLARPRRI